MKMENEQLTHTQLASLLPTQEELKRYLSKVKCDAVEIAIHRITTDIVAAPTSHELWCDLAFAFGRTPELQCKYFYVAHRLCPDNMKILENLASSCNLLGDYKQAMQLMEKVIVCASSDEERVDSIESKNRMQFFELSRRATPNCESWLHH
ncbi:MAG: hypothetical protein A3J49_08565 [Gallionellales bacterium RIFCSPHIGHO2_02_FULL_57_16]|nr:MAG: hypothetical protein A3J49_08565 [Gallionellales bacterium RIFCSPHIGHO2_02_FULL_57_16]